MKSKLRDEAFEVMRYSTLEEAEFLKSVPVFINVHDRLSCLQQQLEWLRRAGHQNITLIDNASTYPPLLRFLNQGKYRAIRLKKNLGHTALWRLKELRGVIAKQWFVYTDPDVIPTAACPLDVVAYLHGLLQDYPFYLKAGLGLRLDDLPDCYHLKQQVIDWEQNLIGSEIAPDVFEADVDTTFALYRPGTPYIIGPSVRFQGRFAARHLPWYSDSSQPDEEERYYRSHASTGVTTWSVYGDTRNEREPGPGGVAAQISMDPHAFLEKILRSPVGRTASLLATFQALSGKSRHLWTKEEPSTLEQARERVLEIIASDDWINAWRLTAPLRQLKSRFTSVLRRW
jgi:hypothetical protein